MRVSIPSTPKTTTSKTEEPKIFVFEEDEVAHISPWLPKNMWFHDRHNGYSIYSDVKNESVFYIDICGKKYPTAKSYFWRASSLSEVFEIIELISKPVRD